jgi:hypothetical protein
MFYHPGMMRHPGAPLPEPPSRKVVIFGDNSA